MNKNIPDSASRESFFELELLCQDDQKGVFDGRGGRDGWGGWEEKRKINGQDLLFVLSFVLSFVLFVCPFRFSFFGVIQQDASFDGSV